MVLSEGRVKMKGLVEYLSERNEEWCLEKWIVPAIGFFSLVGMGACIQRGLDYNYLVEEHDRIIQEVRESALEREMSKGAEERVKTRELTYITK